jgi:hypothetical protein
MAENTNAKKHADSIGLRYARYKIPIAKITAFENASPHMSEIDNIAIHDRELIQFDILIFIF